VLHGPPIHPADSCSTSRLHILFIATFFPQQLHILLYTQISLTRNLVSKLLEHYIFT